MFVYQYDKNLFKLNKKVNVNVPFFNYVPAFDSSVYTSENKKTC